MAVSGTIHSRSNTYQLLKTIFDTDLQEAIQNETPFLKYARTKQFPLDGSDFTIAVHVKRNWGIQFTNVGDDLPDSGQTGFVNGSIRASRVFAAFQIDNELIKLADRQEATFSERVEAIYDDTKNALMKEGERVLLGDGSGVLVTLANYVGGAVKEATFTVDASPASGFEDTRFLEEGMRFNIWDGDTSIAATCAAAGDEESGQWGYITSIDPDGVTFKAKLTTDVNWNDASIPGVPAAGMVVTRAKNTYKAPTTGTRTSKEANGIGLIADNNSSFMGIDGTAATGIRRWRGTVLDAVGNPFSAGILAQAIIKARQASAMLDHPNVVYTHPAQTYALVYGMAGTYPDIRYSRDDVNKFGTTNRPVFNIDGKDVVLETVLDMQKSKMYLFKGDALLYGELQAPGLEDFGDISILPAVNTATHGIVAAQKGWFSWRFNMGCLRRNAFVQIKNLLVPAGM